MLRRKIVSDNRGFFTRLYAEKELSELGRPTNAVHINSSTSTSTGTLRGIHFQYPPYAETKIVSCVNGAVWDVGVDLRPQSSTRFHWFGVELTPQNGLSLLIPEGFGHAFITLKPKSTLVYVLSAEYSIDHESGLKFDDPILDIKWPIEPKVLSKKDLNWGSIESRLSELDLNFKKKWLERKNFNL